MPTANELHNLIEDLRRSGFQGDIETDYATRMVASTDNSIYQLTPQAIFYPRIEQDINLLLGCVYQQRAAGFSITARGAGTGTNGQSLGESLLLDCSRHLNNIIEYDEQKQTVTVQPGVVLDQLNAYLKPYGVFFPIDISSSSRATIGGMVATDASGKGSLIYGKTSGYIESMQLALCDGSSYQARAHSLYELSRGHSDIPEFMLPIFLQLAQYEQEINEKFSGIERGLTGYNLQQCIAQTDVFNPCYLLSGSEGTLGITKSITLKVIPRPGHSMLTVIFYSDFQQGLEHVQELLKSQPAAIEMLDDKVLQQAQKDSVWFNVKAIFGDTIDTDIKALNYVEHIADSEQQLEQQQQQLQEILDQTSQQYSVVTSKIERKPDNISALWEVRKRAVGLLGKSQDGKRGIAFVEDTAVPVKNLSKYINGFRDILDKHGLEYGMYGHADAGVLHVRPVLDLLQQQDRNLIRTISDQVAILAKQNNGVLWGEHGRGFRGEYTPLFFGESLYPVLCDIKNHFDPFDLLNRGKLVRPSVKQQITRLDDISYRAEFDSLISHELQQQYQSSLSCNGNGACFNWSYDEAMCPSYKATRNKLYSPKGRAALFREWLRRPLNKAKDEISPAIEQALYESLSLCLSCKSCTSSCPLKVDIPEMKSQFLQHWHKHHSAPLSDFFIRNFDLLTHWGSKLPALSNWLLRNTISSQLIERFSGLTRLPLFSNMGYSSVSRLDKNAPTDSLAKNAVILLCDNYLDYFDRPVLQSSCDLLSKLGFPVYLSQPIANGKLLHVKGYRELFRQQSQQVLLDVSALAQSGATLVSVETVSRLMFDMEFPLISGQDNKLNILSIESFLVKNLPDSDLLPKLNVTEQVTLLPHCLEQTTARESSDQWQQIFSSLGIQLEVVNAGCCGMSGIFGHEVAQQKLSNDIFSLNWKAKLQCMTNEHAILLATGFSCRCQSKQHDFPCIHPVQYLEQLLPWKQQSLQRK
jgi:FAD/FMN-containing dehydrogenase/Fe-S oxidoreductase